MIVLTTIEEVHALIEENQFSFLYISRENCSVCHTLLPQVKEVVLRFPKIQFAFINADDVEEIAGHFSIFTVPAMLLFIDGKEYIREARFVHIDELEKKINKLYHLVIEQ